MTPNPSRVLIVDDEPRWLDEIRQIASGQRFDVRLLDDPCRVAAAVSTWNPGLIIMDIVMPGRDGVELLAELETIGFAGSIVLMSRSIFLRMSLEIARVRGLTVLEAVSKPFAARTMESILEKYRRQFHSSLFNTGDERASMALCA